MFSLFPHIPPEHTKLLGCSPLSGKGHSRLGAEGRSGQHGETAGTQAQLEISQTKHK